jgi:3-isopropylmalate/(R)-2-methylmalate dehydratase small subunit
VDTDQIIPAQYLKVTDKKGLAEGLFSGWRYLPNGEDNPDFPLNNPLYKEAEILLAGDNFGCGSSREHAPWALTQWGIRAVISTSFADIFRNNALKNGLLPIVISPALHQLLFEALKYDPEFEATIDLQTQTLSLPDDCQTKFSIDPFSKKCLEEGIDPLGYLFSHQDRIKSFREERIKAGFIPIHTLGEKISIS